jgi:uncharacterized protein (DUF983 family)
MDWENILFVVNPKSSNACEVCGKEYNEEESFYKYNMIYVNLASQRKLTSVELERYY